MEGEPRLIVLDRAGERHDQLHEASGGHDRAISELGLDDWYLEGEWIRIQDGVEHHVKAGDFWQTPPNVPHGGRTLDTRCVVLDIFAPPREEYRQAGTGLGSATLAR